MNCLVIKESRDSIFFWRSKHFISTFCVCTDGFQGISKAFHNPVQFLTFYLLLWNYLLIWKMLTKTLLKIFFCVIGRCSLVPTFHSMQGKCARILQYHRWLLVSIFSVKIAALGTEVLFSWNLFKEHSSSIQPVCE